MHAGARPTASAFAAIVLRMYDAGAGAGGTGTEADSFGLALARLC